MMSKDMRGIVSAFSRITLVLGFAAGAYAAQSINEQRARYLEIIKIENPEQRIISELELVLLGVADPYTLKARNMESLQSQASANPNDVWQYDFTFSRGLSLDELAGLIRSSDFDVVNGVVAKTVRDDGLVETLGFTDFDLYSGTPHEVLRFLVAKYRHLLRIQRETGGPVHADDVFAENWLADPDAMRFYQLQVQMTAEKGERLYSKMSASIMFADMRKQLGGPTRPRAPRLRKIPVPKGEAVFTEDEVQQLVYPPPPNSASAVEIDDAIGRTAAASAVPLNCNASAPCPPDNTWVPRVRRASGVWARICITGQLCVNTGVANFVSKFDATTDTSSSIPIQLWAFKNSSLPHCNPSFNGAESPCRQGGVPQQNVVFVPDAGLEHQVEMRDWQCSLPRRSGTAADAAFNCLVTTNYRTNLPGRTYLGSTLLDIGRKFKPEVGTHAGQYLIANKEYRSQVGYTSRSFASIRARGRITMVHQIMDVRGLLPAGLDEFKVDERKGPVYRWRRGPRRRRR